MEIFGKNKLRFVMIALIFAVGFLFYGFPERVSAQTGGCEVTSAKFRTNATTNDPNNFLYADPENPEVDNRPIVYIDIQTQGCVGDTIELSITQEGIVFDQSAPSANDREINVTNDQFSLVYRAGEDYCGTLTPWVPSGGVLAVPTQPVFPTGNFSMAGVWDCDFFLEIEDDNGTEEFATGSLSLNATTMDFSGAIALQYDCSGLVPGCISNWQIIQLPGNSEGIIEYGASISQEEGDEFNSPPIGNTAYQGTDFYLAPLPGFSDQTGCQNPPCSRLGDFLRGFFTLLIIVAGLLAFIMIVVGGITWATSDAISGKSEGKEMIGNAVLGLILALGSWVILNTINPNLASNLGITIPVVSINPAHEPETGIGNGAVGETITLNLAGGGTTTLAACDETKMEQVTAFGKTFKIYEGLVSNIQSINAEWLAMPEDQRYEVKSIGGYNCRNVKGTNTWSAHAFGLAVDINPAKNPFSPASQNQLTTDMPPSFVEIWTSHGWGWGGAWTSLKDAMHFSKYPTSEGGNGLVSQ